MGYVIVSQYIITCVYTNHRILSHAGKTNSNSPQMIFRNTLSQYWYIRQLGSLLGIMVCANISIFYSPFSNNIDHTHDLLLYIYIYISLFTSLILQFIPRNMHTVCALLCFLVDIHWLIFPYPSGLHYWYCGNLTIAPVPAKQPWWICINTSCEFIMNDCITTTKQSTTKPCAYFLGYTVATWWKTLCSKSDVKWNLSYFVYIDRFIGK